MTEDTLFFNGKKYISSRRAAEISSYSIDYLGQLSRKGKLESEMVGRNRYVCESSLLEYLGDKSNKSKKTYAENKLSKELKGSSEVKKTETKTVAPLPAETQSETPFQPVEKPEEKVEEAVLNEVPEEKIVPKTQEEVSYVFENEESFAEQTKRHKPGFAKQFVGSVAVLALMVTFLNLPVAKTGFQNFMSALTLNVEERVEFNEQEVTTVNQKDFSSIKNTLITVDRVFIGVLEKVDNSVIALFRKLRRNTLVLAGKIKDRFAPETETKIVYTSNETTESEVQGNGLTEEQIRAIVRDILLDEKDIFAPEGPYGGIVTNPSGTEEENSDFTQRVQDTFSDQVDVNIDESRSFGRVQPVFRNTEDLNDDYLFVFVPVNE